MNRLFCHFKSKAVEDGCVVAADKFFVHVKSDSIIYFFLGELGLVYYSGHADNYLLFILFYSFIDISLDDYG